MNRFFFVTLSFFFLATACNKSSDPLQKNAISTASIKAPCPCIPGPVIETTDIIKINNTTILGSMSVWNTNDSIYVTLSTPGKNFNKSALYIGSCASIPSNTNQYPNVINHNPNPTTYTYIFENTYNPCDTLCIYASVTGISGGGGNAIASLQYIIKEICSCNIQIGDFRTQSKGGWGAPPNGNNPANYMYNHWNTFGAVTIGCATTTMSFGTPQDVTNYLPNGNNATAPFNSNLATQVLALSISVALDNNVSSFGASNDSLACLIVDSPNYPDFNGMSVQDVLNLANDVLGGCNTNYSFSQMTAIVEAINLNFHDGTVNNGLLTCGSCN